MIEEERRIVKEELVAMLEPLGFRLASPVPILAGWTVIWYWGRETGFAGGRTAEAVARSAERQVFGGL